MGSPVGFKGASATISDGTEMDQARGPLSLTMLRSEGPEGLEMAAMVSAVSGRFIEPIHFSLVSREMADHQNQRLPRLGRSLPPPLGWPGRLSLFWMVLCFSASSSSCCHLARQPVAGGLVAVLSFADDLEAEELTEPESVDSTSAGPDLTSFGKRSRSPSAQRLEVMK